MSILYALLMGFSMIYGLVMFPVYHENVQILLIPLIGLGSWIFGKKAGLMLILPAMAYSYFLTSILYADMDVYHEAKGGGIIIMSITATLVGKFRTNYDNLKRTNKVLDRRVEDRKAELRKLTLQLLNDAEATRIRHGQALHDGIGQQLTGIQLYCTSLAEQLEAERNPSASLVYSIRSKTKTAHDIIRKTARMLFPVRMHETGLIPAVNELVSCFNEMEHMAVMLEVNGDFRDMPDEIALGLYRICHETTMCAATALNASEIQLGIKEEASDYEISMQHNGTPWAPLNENMEQRVILYRLQTLQGISSSKPSANGAEKIVYRIPKV